MKKITTLLILFSFISFSQNKDKIKAISASACECIIKIDIDKSKKEKSEEIKSCIQGASMSYQVENSIMPSLEKVLDSVKANTKTIKDTTVVAEEGKSFVINASQNYEEIEEYLYDNCPALKKIYFVDNTEYENSYSDRKKAMKFYEKGQVAFQKQDYYEAIIQFSKAVKKDKKFAFAWDNLGFSYRKVKNYKQAIESYKKSLALDPKGKMPLMNIAVAYQLNNNAKGAIDAYEQYKKHYPEDPEGFYGIGRIQYIIKDYEPALVNMIKAYKLYVEMDSPYNIDAQKHIGFIWKGMKESGQLEAFNRITKENKLEVNFED